MRKLKFFGELHGTRVELVQVQKRTAKKLYNAGKIIYLCPCKMTPIGVWNIGCAVSKEYNPYQDVRIDDNKSFEHVVNSFNYYNCGSDTGKYITFYEIKFPQK